VVHHAVVAVRPVVFVLREVMPLGPGYTAVLVGHLTAQIVLAGVFADVEPMAIVLVAVVLRQAVRPEEMAAWPLLLECALLSFGRGM